MKGVEVTSGGMIGRTLARETWVLIVYSWCFMTKRFVFMWGCDEYVGENLVKFSEQTKRRM